MNEGQFSNWAVGSLLVVIFIILWWSKRHTDRWLNRTTAELVADNLLLCIERNFPEFAPKAIMGDQVDYFIKHLVDHEVEADLSPDKEEIFVRKDELLLIVKVY